MSLSGRLSSRRDWVSLAAEDYYELTKLALDALRPSGEIRSVFALENEYDTISVFYFQSGDIKELDYDFLQSQGKIDGRQYLAELESIYLSYPSIDCSEVIRLFHEKAKALLPSAGKAPRIGS